MGQSTVVSLAEVFSQVPDPRDPRGVRHPVRGILTLVFLGLLARVRELAVLERWARVHWDQLREPLGFDRDEPPCATTLSRLLARLSLAEFSRAFGQWLRHIALTDTALEAAVDAKTSCQGFDPHGEPVQILTVFVQRLKLVLGQWSVRGEKTNEPTVLKKHLPELLADFPMLKLLTGDAIYAQRPLAEVLVSQECAYLLQIKDNQPAIVDALKQCLGRAHERPAAAETVEKKGSQRSPPIVVLAGRCGAHSHGARFSRLSHRHSYRPRRHLCRRHPALPRHPLLPHQPRPGAGSR